MTTINAIKYYALLNLIIFCAPAQAQQICNTDQIRQTAPASRFIDNGNQTVTDRATGLIWKQCAQGLFGAGCATGVAVTFTWQQALVEAQSENFAGQTDWRLPNIKELSSIVERACFTPAINVAVFPNTPNVIFWSASPNANSADSAWGVDFGFGVAFTDFRDGSNSVRLVRGGQ